MFNRFLLSTSLFIVLFSCTVVMPSAGPLQAQSIYEHKITSQIFFIDLLSEGIESDDIKNSSIEKIDNNLYQIIFKTDLNGEPQKLIIDQSNFDEIYKQSNKKTRKQVEFNESGSIKSHRTVECCYLKIKNPKLKPSAYISIDRSTLDSILTAKPNIKETKRPIKRAKKVVEQNDDTIPFSIERTPITPLSPDDFKVPFPGITSDSDHLPSETEGVIVRTVLENVERQWSSAHRNITDQIPHTIENEINQTLTNQKQANIDAQKCLGAYFQTECQKKMSNSAKIFASKKEQWHLSPPEKNDLEKVNSERQEKNNQPLTEEQYLQHLYDLHLDNIASWHIKQHKIYNATLEKAHLPTMDYKDFCLKSGTLLKKREVSTPSDAPLTDRFTDMINNAEKQLKLIETLKLEKHKKQFQQATQNNSLTHYATMRGQNMGTTLALGTLIDEISLVAALDLTSLSSNKEMEKTIQTLEERENDLAKIIAHKKEYLSSINTKEQEEKELNELYFNITQTNQDTLHPTKKKSKEELLNSLKVQRDKHART